MAAAVVLQQPDPNAALNSFVGGASEAYNAQKDKAQALALATRKQTFDESTEAAHQALANRAQTNVEMNTQSEIQSRALHDKIDKADQDFKRSLDDLTTQTAKAHLQGEQVGVLDAQARLKHDLIINKYADALQKAGLSEAQARAHVAQVDSQYASIFAAQKVQEGKDAHAQAGATLDSTRATTAYTGALAANVGKTTSGGTDYGAMLELRRGLSTGAEALVEQVEQKKLSPSQAYLAAAKDPSLAKELPKLKDIFAKGGYDAAAPPKENAQKDVQKTPGFDALPGNVQAAILRQTKQGVAAKAAAQVVLDAKQQDGSPAVDAPTQQQIKTVFGLGAPEAAAPGAKPAAPGPTSKTGLYGQQPPPGPAGNPFAAITSLFPHAFQGYQGH